MSFMSLINWYPLTTEDNSIVSGAVVGAVVGGVVVLLVVAAVVIKYRKRGKVTEGQKYRASTELL